MKKITVFGIAVLATATCHSAVLYDLNDTVLDGGTGANTFFVANSQTSPAGLSYSETGPTLTHTFGGANNYTYFVANFEAFSLTETGDAITLSFNLTPSSTSAFRDVTESFRIGLFNSNGTQLTGNASGTGAAALNNDTGYVATYNPRGGTSASNTLRQRSGGNDNLWTSGQYATVSGAPTLTSPGTGVITGSLTLTRVETGIQITSIINGGTAQTVIDTSGLVTTFDTFSIFANSGANNATLTFSELTVSTVPEPSVAVFLGLAGVALLSLRRRRGRAETPVRP